MLGICKKRMTVVFEGAVRGIVVPKRRLTEEIKRSSKKCPGYLHPP